MKTVAIIQARLNSSRLHQKMLLPLLGKPILFHVIDRCDGILAVTPCSYN